MGLVLLGVDKPMPATLGGVVLVALIAFGFLGAPTSHGGAWALLAFAAPGFAAIAFTFVAGPRAARWWSFAAVVLAIAIAIAAYRPAPSDTILFGAILVLPLLAGRASWLATKDSGPAGTRPGPLAPSPFARRPSPPARGI